MAHCEKPLGTPNLPSFMLYWELVEAGNFLLTQKNRGDLHIRGNAAPAERSSMCNPGMRLALARTPHPRQAVAPSPELRCRCSPVRARETSDNESQEKVSSLLRTRPNGASE